MTVVVVTDRPRVCRPRCAKSGRYAQVPLHILLDGIDLRDGVDEIPDDIYQRHATTAAATPAELCAAYQQALADSGGDGVVAVHISSALSGTYRAAELAAAELGPAVRVVDSKSAAMGTGFVALAAARAAAAAGDVDTVAGAAAAAVRRAHAFVVVQRLDNLRRSGRIGGAKAWLGTALALKPLLRVDDGKLVLAQRVRTVRNAMAAMIDRVCELVGDSPARSGGAPRRQPGRRERRGGDAGGTAPGVRAGDRDAVGAGARVARRRRSRRGLPGRVARLALSAKRTSPLQRTRILPASRHTLRACVVVCTGRQERKQHLATEIEYPVQCIQVERRNIKILAGRKPGREEV